MLRYIRQAEAEEIWVRDTASRRVTAVSISPRGSYLAVCLREPGEVLLVDTQTGEPVWSSPMTSPECVAVSPDEKWAAVGTSNEIVFLYALPGDGTSVPLRRAKQEALDSLSARSHGSTVRGLVFSRDSRTLVSCASRVGNTPKRNELRCWDVASGTDLGEWFRNDLPQAPHWLAVSPSGRRLAVGGHAGWLEVRRFTPADR